MTAPLLATRDLSVSLGGRTVLDRVSLDVSAGEFTVIAGPNGAGKTTLLRAAAGLVLAAGTVSLSGDPLPSLSLAERARRIAYLPQGHVVHWPLPVFEVVALGRLPRGRGADLSAADEAAVERAMAATGVAEYAGRSVTTLSGGERARVALARVLATEAPLILADEPTASLDVRYQLLVMQILKRHAAAGGSAVAVIHDLPLAAAHADRLMLLDQGRVVADGIPAVVLTGERLREVFGVTAEFAEVGGRRVVVPLAVNDR